MIYIIQVMFNISKGRLCWVTNIVNPPHALIDPTSSKLSYLYFLSFKVNTLV